MNPSVQAVLRALGKLLIVGIFVGMTILSLPGIAALGWAVVVVYPLIIGFLVVALVFSFLFRSKELPQYSRAGQLLYILWFPAFVVGVTAPIRALGVAFASVPYLVWFDVAAGALGIGVTILLTAFDLAWRRGQLEQLESLPTSRIRSAAIGLAEFRGKVSPEAVPKDRIPAGTGKGLDPFYLEDATGRILVDPRKAHLRSGLAGSFGGRICEAVLDGWLTAGKEVYVIGSVQRNPAAAPDAVGSEALVVAPLDEPVAAGFFRRLLLQRRDQAPQSQRDIQHLFFLSDGTQDQARRRLRAGIGHILGIAAVWIAASAWMVATQLPKTRGIAYWSVQEVFDFGKKARPAELGRRLQTQGASERTKILNGVIDSDLIGHDALAAVIRGFSDPSSPVRDATFGCVMRLGYDKWRVELPPHHWPTVTAAVEAGLSLPEPNGRLAALRISGMASKAPGMAALLARAAEDPDSDVRTSALVALEKMGPNGAAAVPVIVRRLDDESVAVRGAAFQALPKMFAGTDGRPLFRELLCRSQPSMRKLALVGLAAPAPQGDDVVGELLTALDDPDAEVRAQAADGLGRYGAAAVAAEPFLVALLSDAFTNVQGTAVQALAKIAPKPAEHVDAVAPLLGGDSWWVRRVAGTYLIDLGDQADRVIPTAIDWLECGGDSVREDVLRLLQESWKKREPGCIGAVGPLAVPSLIKILEGDSSVGLKNQAISILEMLGEDAAPAVPAILALGQNSYHQSNVRGAIRRLGPAAVAAAPAIVEDLFKRDAWEASETLILMAPRDKTLIARLIEGLRSSRDDIRGACVRVVAVCGRDAEEAAPLLADLLRANYDEHVMDALVSIGPASVAPTAAALDDPRSEARARAAEVLGRLGPAARPATAALKERLTDSDGGVRKHVTLAISRIDPVTALPVLVPLLKHADEAVRKDAMQGLEKIAPAVMPPLPVLIEALGDAATEPGAAKLLGGMGDAARPALPALLQSHKRFQAGQSGRAILRILKLPIEQVPFEASIRSHLGKVDASDEHLLGMVKEMVDLDLPGVIETIVPRIVAARSVGPRARELLSMGLKHDQGLVRLCAIHGLARIGPGSPDVVDAFRKELRDPKQHFKLEVVKAIRSMGPSGLSALPDLRAQLTANYEALAAEAALTIGLFGPRAQEAREALEVGARKGSPKLREAASVALERIVRPPSEAFDRIWSTDPRSPAAAELYRELGGHPDPVVRETAVAAWLWRLPDAQELAEPILALDDSHASIRAAAAEVLLDRGGAEPYLIPCLNDASPRVRRLAADAVRGSTAAAIEAAPALTRLLRDDDPNVRMAASAALVPAGAEARGAVSELLRIAKTGDEQAIVTLGSIGPDAAEAVPLLIEQAQRNLWRAGVIQALGRIGPAARDAVPLLTQGLTHQGQHIRWECAEALGGIGPDAASAVPALLAAGRNRQDDRMTITVSRSLARMGPVALPQLIEAFKRGHQAASNAIGMMGPAAADAVPALREALRGDSVVMQFLAIRALRGIGPAAVSAVPELRRFLKLNNNIRYEAERALASIERGKR